MRTILNSTIDALNLIKYPTIDKNNDLKIEIVSFRRFERNYHLQLSVMHLESDNYQLFLKGTCLTFIISEPWVSARPLHMHNVNWKIYNHQTYEVLKHADIWLPGDNFYLIKHVAYPENQLLEVILGTIYKNKIWF